MKMYIGNALSFPISGREEVGMIITINLEELRCALDKFDKVSPYDHTDLELTVLPLKPHNVVENKKTHSVKLTNIKEHEA